jgi:hypothetical protein
VDLLAIGLGDKHLDGCEKSRGCCWWSVMVDEEEVRSGHLILVSECTLTIGERTGHGFPGWHGWAC